MGDDTPAHVAQVSVESASLPSPDAGSHDALEETDLRIRDNTGRSNDSGITGSTSTTSRSNSLCTDASDASVTTAAVSPCDPLAAGAVGSMHMVLDEHPLSPSVSLGTSKRTSYFRTSVHPGISPVANVIFPEEDDEDTPGEDGVDRQLEAQARPSMEGPALAASPVNTDRTPSSSTSPLPTIFRLPHAPHRLSAKAVDERLREVVPNEIRGVILAQELAKQLEVVQRELDDLKELQTARENGLIALLKENGNVSESLISRTLVRAKAESGETRRIERSDRHGWKIVLSNVGKDVQISRSSPPKRLPLDEDLQDAMFENDFKETARSISPSLPITNKSSPQIRQTAASSPTPVLAASLHERRNRQPSQSLSARLFGGFTPPATSHLSPSSDSFQAGAHPPLSASSGEGSPGHVAAPTNSKKSRANSIHSVASASSHQSSRGISGWTGSLWSWNRSGKSRHFSDNEDDDEEPPSEDESTPIVTEAFTQARAAAKQTQQEDKDKTVKGRPRTLSKGSSNSASTKSCGTTAATSFSSHAVTQIEQQSEDEHSGKLRTSPSATSTLTMEDPDKTDRSSGKGEGPVKTLLGRRPSALHPDAALSAHSVTIPVTAASSPRTSLSGKFEPLQTSTSILQSLNLQIREKTLEHDERDAPLHFRAVSQSASTIGKSSGRSPANELFRAPNKVSDNISEWTYRLLSSFQTPVVMPDIATIASTPTSADMARTSSKSPSTSRSTSPMISQSKGKATLSPATVLNDSSTKTVRLSVSSPSSQDATFGSFASNAAAEAMPLAPSEVHKQKGYIASAKGTIGRALGLSGSSSGKASSSPSGASQKSRYGKTRSNSLKAVIEPALTVPSTFTSFASPSSGALPSTTSPVQPDSHSHRVPAATPLEMGTIVAPEAKPPTLSSDLTDQMKDGPLVDRFGFVYDVKVGMKLLKEYRKKQEVGEETVISLDPPAEVNVEDLREAIGPSPSATPGIETALRGAALQLGRDKSTESKDAERQSLDMISEHETMQPPAQLPSNHSIRRLLSQLGEMNESVEQSQKEAWDHFIKRRRKKAQRPPKDDDAAAASKARKKRMTIVEAPLSIATADLNDDNADNQFSDNLVGVASMGADKQDDKTFRHLVRSGIPIAYRPSIWAEVSGASEIREPGLYQELLTRHEGEISPCLEQIDMDTHRTFPTNVFFAGSGPGVAKLRRVLIAYSWRDPAIGYCQGMNLLAALLLLVYPDEEDAFWMLASVLERTLPSDYYSSQLLVSQADQRVLKDLIQLALPDLYDHLEDLGVDLPAITFGWFLSLFTDALPIQTLLRVWDVLLVYGPISLFKIAIAIFKIHSADIFATDSASNFYVLLTNLTSHMYSADKLLKTAFEDLKFIKRHDVESRRLKHVADIEEELAPRQTTPAPAPAPLPPSTPSPAPSLEIPATMTT